MATLFQFCRRLRSAVKLFRFAELCICLAFLWCFSSAIRVSGEYLRSTFLLVLSPMCIFLFGNAIVVTLLAKSGLFTGQTAVSIDNAVAEFYEELTTDNSDDIELPPQMEVVFHDKEIICEEKKNLNVHNEIEKNDDENDDDVVEKVVVYRRSKSEKVREGVKEEKLRRSETDVCRRKVAGEEEVVAEMTAEDGEEFRRTIEAFIAKQMRFHLEERLAVVLHGQA